MAFEEECHQEAKKRKAAGEDWSQYRYIPRKQLTIQAKPLEESGKPGEEHPKEKTLEQCGVKPDSTMAVLYADPAEKKRERRAQANETAALVRKDVIAQADCVIDSQKQPSARRPWRRSWSMGSCRRGAVDKWMRNV